MKYLGIFVSLFLFIITSEIRSTSAAALRPKLESAKSISQEDVRPKIHRHGRHQKNANGVEELLNLVESDGFTILLLRRRGRRNAEIKLTAMQLKRLRETLGNAVLEQISKSSNPVQQKYNTCFLNQLMRKKSTTTAERICKRGFT